MTNAPFTMRGAPFLPYLILMAALVLWLLFILPGQPMKPYVRIFFVGGLLCICAEGMVGSLLAAYQARAGLLGDTERDVMLAGFLVTAALHPLMAVIYARLASAHPQVKAAGAAIALGFLEYYFVRSGHMVYRLWHPVVSSLFYFGFLTAVWFVHSHRWAVPTWTHVLAMAFWLVHTVSYLLHGVLGFWQYPVIARGDPGLGNQLTSNLYVTAICVPIAVLSSGILPSRWPAAVPVGLGTLALVAAEAVMHGTGMVLYLHHWNIWLSATVYAAELGAVALYARWIRLPAPGPSQI